MKACAVTKRIWGAMAVVLLASFLVSACRSFSRELNDALPEFMRSEPGAEEIERYRNRVRVLNRSKEEVKIAKAAFAEAITLYDSGDFDAAQVAFELYLVDFPDTADDRRSRYLLILCYLETEEATSAREAISDFIGLYPVSEFNDEIEAAAWRLAHEYIDGKHDWLFVGKESDGFALLRSIVLAFPNGNHADEAQWLVGNKYFADADYIAAEIAYGAIVDRYPRSPWAGRATFNRARCRLALCKGAVYDEVNMKDTIKAFRTYLKQYPEGDRRKEANEHIAFVIELLGEKQVRLAQWYIGQDKPRAARFFLLRCLRLWPHSQAVAEARELLAELPDDNDEDFFDEWESQRGGAATSGPTSRSATGIRR